MVTETNPLFFKRLERIIDLKLEEDLKSLMAQEVESEAKRIVYLGDEGDNSHLHRRTGHLGGSITTESEREGDVITVNVGTNVVYAKIHELGGDIDYDEKDIEYHIPAHHVKGHTAKRNGKTYKVNAHDVGAYTKTVHRKARTVHIPARPFLVPAFESRADNVKDGLTKKVREYIKTAASK